MKKLYFLIALIVHSTIFSQNAYLLPHELVCPGDELTLYAGGSTSYAWALKSDPDSILSTQSYLTFFPEAGDTVILYTNNDTLSTSIWMDPYQCDYYCYMPNFFSPNGDNYNENLCVILYGKPTNGIRLTICKRDGKIIYDETSLYPPCWDGRHQDTGEALQSGMYLWFVSYIREDNTTAHLNGFVILAK
ncbi:MAG: gliding motility-associated C-terminal domain-containing protein [Crocinitomicaceae bacterium]